MFLDRHPEDGIRVGDRWEEVLYDRLHSVDAVVCVVTEHHVASKWCFAEVALAKVLGHHLLPVSAQTGVLHPLLGAYQAVDYQADPNGARAALRERLRAIEAGGGTAWDASRPLFPGLSAFDTSDAPVFFGRGARDPNVVAIDLIAGTVNDWVQEPDAIDVSPRRWRDGELVGHAVELLSSLRHLGSSGLLDDAHGIAVYRLDPVDAPTPVGTVSGMVTALRWKPDGTRHAITTDGRCIDLAAGDGQEPLGDVLAVTADGEHLLLDAPLRLHSVTWQAARPLAIERRVVAAGFSEDGSRLAVATWGSLSVFDVGTGRLVTRFGEHDDEEGDLYQGIALNRDGTRLVTSSLGGGRAHVWEVDTGEALGPVPRDLLGHLAGWRRRHRPWFPRHRGDLSAGVEIRLGAPPDDVTMVVAPDRTAMAAVRSVTGARQAGSCTSTRSRTASRSASMPVSASRRRSARMPCTS